MTISALPHMDVLYASQLSVSHVREYHSALGDTALADHVKQSSDVSGSVEITSK